MRTKVKGFRGEALTMRQRARLSLSLVSAEGPSVAGIYEL